MRARGHTLWELVTVVAVVAVLATLASTDFTRLRATMSTATAADQLLRALHFARSRAILGGIPTVVCLSNDGEHCIGRGRARASGWILFENVRAEFTPVRDPGEPILRRQRVERPTALQATRGAVTYWPTVRAGMTSTFEFCSAIAGVPSRAIIVSQTGRPRLRIGTARGESTLCST